MSYHRRNTATQGRALEIKANYAMMNQLPPAHSQSNNVTFGVSSHVVDRGQAPCHSPRDAQAPKRLREEGPSYGGYQHNVRGGRTDANITEARMPSPVQPTGGSSRKAASSATDMMKAMEAHADHAYLIKMMVQGGDSQKDSLLLVTPHSWPDVQPSELAALISKRPLEAETASWMAKASTNAAAVALMEANIAKAKDELLNIVSVYYDMVTKVVRKARQGETRVGDWPLLNTISLKLLNFWLITSLPSSEPSWLAEQCEDALEDAWAREGHEKGSVLWSVHQGMFKELKTSLVSQQKAAKMQTRLTEPQAEHSKPPSAVPPQQHRGKSQPKNHQGKQYQQGARTGHNRPPMKGQASTKHSQQQSNYRYPTGQSVNGAPRQYQQQGPTMLAALGYAAPHGSYPCQPIAPSLLQTPSQSGLLAPPMPMAQNGMPPSSLLQPAPIFHAPGYAPAHQPFPNQDHQWPHTFR